MPLSKRNVLHANLAYVLVVMVWNVFHIFLPFHTRDQAYFIIFGNNLNKILALKLMPTDQPFKMIMQQKSYLPGIMLTVIWVIRVCAHQIITHKRALFLVDGMSYKHPK